MTLILSHQLVEVGLVVLQAVAHGPFLGPTGPVIEGLNGAGQHLVEVARF